MNAERTYPCTVWVLLPSFRPQEREAVRFSKSIFGDRIVFKNGVTKLPEQVFDTKAEAIAFGRKRQVELADRIEALKATHIARSAALNKAEAK